MKESAAAIVMFPTVLIATKLCQWEVFNITCEQLIRRFVLKSVNLFEPEIVSTGGKCEGKGARISTAVCLPSLWPQDQVELVQTVGPFPGARQISSCFSYGCVETLTLVYLPIYMKLRYSICPSIDVLGVKR